MIKIVPDSQPGAHRTGTLYDIDAKTITDILGFKPNVQDDPDKVVSSWGFQADGQQCAIWDYKGSHKNGTYSTFGLADVFEQLFPAHYV